jgi:hypothetical protein
MDYKGVIIEESLENRAVLKDIKIISTKIEPVTAHHKTPWLKQWTLHAVVIPADDVNKIADGLSKSLENNYWYSDFKNDKTHYIIFPQKVFKIDRTKAEEYKVATEFGLTLGIPEYQLDFSPYIIQWERPKE